MPELVSDYSVAIISLLVFVLIVLLQSAMVGAAKASAGVAPGGAPETDYDNKHSYSQIRFIEYTPTIIEKITLFPNPTSGNIALDFGVEINEVVLVEVYDMNGRLILSTSYDYISLDVSALAPGLYSLHCFVQGESHRTKFVKE